jgi:RND family efflux transporter MFP subunit
MKKWIVFVTAVLLPNILWAADIQATLQWSQRVELSTPVSGVVKEVNVDVGDLVKKGQVLLTLDSTAYRAKVAENQSEITRLAAEEEEAKRDLDRVQGLYERTVVSTTDLDQAKLRAVNSRSMLAEARARLRLNQKALDETSMRAPFDAVVVLRQAEPGLSVAAGLQPQMLLTLARSGEMIARAYLSSPQMDKLKTGQKVTVSASGSNYTGNIKTLGLEPIKIKEDWVYPVDVIFSSQETLRAGAPAQLKLP